MFFGEKFHLRIVKRIARCDHTESVIGIERIAINHCDSETKVSKKKHILNRISFDSEKSWQEKCSADSVLILLVFIRSRSHSCALARSLARSLSSLSWIGPLKKFRSQNAPRETFIISWLPNTRDLFIGLNQQEKKWTLTVYLTWRKHQNNHRIETLSISISHTSNIPIQRVSHYHKSFQSYSHFRFRICSLARILFLSRARTHSFLIKLCLFLDVRNTFVVNAMYLFYSTYEILRINFNECNQSQHSTHKPPQMNHNGGGDGGTTAQRTPFGTP